MTWNRAEPHPLLVEWAETRELEGAGRRAVVVGCGLGADAEYIASRGFQTVVFDISETAIRIARRRFPRSAVHYVAADLLDSQRNGCVPSTSLCETGALGARAAIRLRLHLTKRAVQSRRARRPQWTRRRSATPFGGRGSPA
jgi:SAM-dependent methyltransferase